MSRSSAKEAAPFRVFARRSEEIAAQFLVSKGYKILERNYRTPRGELDLVATEGEALVFVEVKARRGFRFGEPAYAVHEQKQRHMIKAALYYLSRKKIQNRTCRFDVVVIYEGGDRNPQVRLIQNAFTLDHFGL